MIFNKTKSNWMMICTYCISDRTRQLSISQIFCSVLKNDSRGIGADYSFFFRDSFCSFVFSPCCIVHVIHSFVRASSTVHDSLCWYRICVGPILIAAYQPFFHLWFSVSPILEDSPVSVVIVVAQNWRSFFLTSLMSWQIRTFPCSSFSPTAIVFLSGLSTRF